MALNKVLLIGNVGNDPEIRYLDSNPQGPQGNAKVASFRLATTERYRDRNGETRENTEWHNIVAWRNSADLVEKFVHKGSQIFIEGRLRTRQWTDQTGAKRFTTEVQADNIQLLGKRPDAQQNPGAQGGYAPQPGGYQGGYPPQSTQSGYQGPGYQPASPAPSVAPGTPGTPGPSVPTSPQAPATPPVPPPGDLGGDDLPF